MGKCAYKHSFSKWYSKITFCWLSSILQTGYSTSLQSEIFGQLPASERSAVQYRQLQSFFLTNAGEKTGETSIDLWICFVKLYWRIFVFGGCLKLLGDILGFVPPHGISVVVNYIEVLHQNGNNSYNELNMQETYTKWDEFFRNGPIMAVTVLLMVLGQGTLSQNSTHIVNVTGIRMKNALQGLIYHKLLKIRKNCLIDRAGYDNVGYVTNLITEDAYNIMSCFWIINYVWAIPLKVVILIYLLYREIGISAVIGSVGCIAVMLILQFVVGRKMSRNYEIISDWCDSRLRRINEILQGIRFVKLCGWETDFIDDVTKLRENELTRLNKDSTYWTIITFLANTSSIIMAVACLALHQYLQNESINLSALLTTLALFNQLTVPLFIFPVILPIVVSAVVSVDRIEKFLALPETETSRNSSTTNCVDGVTNDSGADVGQRDRRERVGLTCDDGGSVRLRKITENGENEEDGRKIKFGAASDQIASTRTAGDQVLQIRKLICSRSDSSKTVLQIDDITIRAGTLNVVIGKKGSGKTSLLDALLEEMTSHSGKIEWKRPTRVGYVPQTPWLLNDTLKRNIVFGWPFNEKHFLRVIQLCALKADVNSLPNKENTTIGDRGITLSAGQKQRIMIARMLYSMPDIFIMDNPFSSLDCKVTDHIFENGIRKIISKRQKTAIMTTNCSKYLSLANQIIVMENCRVKVVGSFEHVQRVAFEEIQALNENTLTSGSASQTESVPVRAKSSFVPLRRRRSTLSGSRYFTRDLLLPTDDCEIDDESTLLRKQKRSRAATVTDFADSPSEHRNVFRMSSLQTNHNRQNSKSKPKCEIDEGLVFRRHRSTISDLPDDITEVNEQHYPNEIRDDEIAGATLEESSVGFEVYMAYVKSCGVLAVFLYFVFTLGWQILRISADLWLSYYIVASANNVVHEKQDIRWQLYVYVALSAAALVFSLSSTAIGQYAAAVSRRTLHARMLNNILKATVQYFDGTPFGSIINRFSTDTEIIDKKISASSQRLIQFQFLCLSGILVNCIVTPWFIIVAIPISLVYFIVQRFYRCSSRKFQRLENTLKTPIIDHFSETFAGLEVIRALDRGDFFTKMFFEKIDRHTNVFLILNSTNRWLGIMLDYLGGIIVFAAMLISMVSVAMKPNLKITPLFGLAINYTLLIPIYLTWVVKFLNDLEIYMGAVQRVRNVTKIPTENYRSKGVKPMNWPNMGEIRFENVTLQYRPQRRNVIQNLTICIESGQKVGICGRTGSGKSSLMMSLLKMVPLVDGKIILDNIDIDSVPLQYLRSKISIVSQDVILFSGNIRQNLDLRGEFSDDEIWRSLELVQIHHTVANIGGLDARVQDGGTNLSVGERQSICLARAILRDTSCLILDEATNSLQPEAETDFLNLILETFRKRTVVVITHRITSLLHFDRVLVMNDGRIVEDGHPASLLSNSNGHFYSLVKIAEDATSCPRRFLF